MASGPDRRGIHRPMEITWIRKPKRDCPPPNHETHVRQLCPRLRQLLFLCRRSLPALAEIIVFVSAVTLARRQLPPGASSQPGVQCRIPSLCRLAYSPIVQHLAQPVAGAFRACTGEYLCWNQSFAHTQKQPRQCPARVCGSD